MCNLGPYCVHPFLMSLWKQLGLRGRGGEGVGVCWTRLLPSLLGLLPLPSERAGNRHHPWLITSQVCASLDEEPPGADPDAQQHLLAMRGSLGPHEWGESLHFLRTRDWTSSKRTGS